MSTLVDREEVDDVHQETADSRSGRPTRPARLPRGITALNEFVQNRMAEERRVLQYNSSCQYVGEAAKKFRSYIGVCVRVHIPITYKEWDDVPIYIRELAYDRLTASFEVDPDSKHHVIMAMSKAFKTFRYNLHKQYIRPFKDSAQPKLMFRPPTTYNFITQEQWEDFVNFRLSDAWKEKSKKNKEKRGLLKYNHRMSRKGYADLGYEKAIDIKTNPSARATLWVEGRKGRDNTIVDPATQEVANRIDECQTQQAGVDILTDVLGTPEHRGRVRGVGQFLAPSVFFRLDQTGRSRMAQTQFASNQPSQPQTQFPTTPVRLDADSPGVGSTHVSGTIHGEEHVVVRDEVVYPQEPARHPDPASDDVGKGVACQLALDDRANIVAIGTVFETKDKFSKVHVYILGKLNARVIVDMVMPGKEMLELPIPVNEELELLHQAVATFVAWTIAWIIMSNDHTKEASVSKLGKRPASAAHSVHSNVGKAGPSVEQQLSRTKGGNMVTSTAQSTQSSSTTPEMLRQLLAYAKEQSRPETLFMIPVPRSMVGSEHAVLVPEEVVHYCKMDLIGYSQILIYNAFCWSTFNQNTLSKFMLVDSERFGFGTTRAKVEPHVIMLADKFDSMAHPRQIVYFPYNTGNHWLLVVLNPQKTRAYVFDSIGKEKVDEKLKNIVNTAYRT